MNCKEYISKFCEKQGLLFNGWLGNKVEGIAILSGLFISYKDIKWDIDANIPKGTIIDFYVYKIENPDKEINYFEHTKMLSKTMENNPTITLTNPDYYGGQNNPYEARKVIRAWGLNFPLGNVVKYIARAGKKPTATALEDLQKAKNYLDDEVKALGGTTGTKDELIFNEWDMIDFSNYCQTVEPYSVSGHSKLKEWMELKKENIK